MKTRTKAGVLILALGLSLQSHAGGPLIVGGSGFNPAAQGQPLVWSTSTPVSYRTADAGSLGKLDNASANARVQQLFQVWQNVKTANISFQRAGNILPQGAYTGGAVDSAAEFNAIEGTCNNGVQSPIIFDANGSLFTALGFDDLTIGFAGPCNADANGQIIAAEAVLNGKWLDNNQTNGELTDRQFDETFVHEFGHFIGLDHSQISVNVLSQPVDQCNRADLEILPVMFPFAHCQARLDEGLPALAPDDEAWVSMLYPETVNDPPGPQQARIRFDSVYGIITGKVFFNDGPTPAQGFNVLARDSNTSNNRTFSAVSGYLFTASLGQDVATNNQLGSPFGSRDLTLVGTYNIPVLPGTYDVTVEAIFEEFTGASSVGPLFPIARPGFVAPAPVSVTVLIAGPTPAAAPNIVFTDQLSRFDQFEGR